MSGRTALVVGAGGVLGAALCAEFASAAYRVIGLRRIAESTPPGAAKILACDLADAAATRHIVRSALDEPGVADVVICNAAHLAVEPLASLRFEDFETAWRVCAASAFATAQAVLPPMRERGSGAFIVTGATASLRGSAGFAALASAKFALRGLVQSLAREFQPAGVHVAHVILDGLLHGSVAATRRAAPQDQCIDPLAAAAIYRMLAEQPRSAWTHELDLRPQSEKF